jgi:glycosyltransferase involved in cell wall biosynthesis
MLNPILWEEPFGMVMIEAMAAGCPVIAFRRGAAGEIVASGKVGFLVNDVAEMVEGMRKIDAIDRKTVRRYIETHFSAQIMAENYTSVYKQVIRMKRNPKRFVPFFGHTSMMSG